MIHFTSAIAGRIGLMAAGLFAAGAAPAEDDSVIHEMRPLMATSIVTGGKHVLGYFRKDTGACRLTLMISEAAGNPAVPASRLDVAVRAGSAAFYDAGNGRGLSFSCASAAEAMAAVKLDNTAWRSDE